MPDFYWNDFKIYFLCFDKECRRRDKRATSNNCEVDEFLVSRMKRQAYNPSGILDIVKLLSKTMGEGGGPGGCMKFPACVLAQKKRRKRHAERVEQYHKEVAAHKQALKQHEEQHLRQKRQFFSPDAGAGCVPCPAWVTLALMSRKKRSTNSSEESEDEPPPRMTLSEAIADIRRRAGYKLGFHDDDKSPRRKQGKCDQTDDCLNEVEYAIFKKVYHNTRVKRELPQIVNEPMSFRKENWSWNKAHSRQVVNRSCGKKKKVKRYGSTGEGVSKIHCEQSMF
ncbi:unnamed protein product [Haemonchus placei]|uniref:40S ribosomal protein S6 n=1 Tax=Haemonchus placei TaxID=6290 RepID=A0A0N4XBN3_HAEPC|nr:unnamed protein product [Haemonchus placei]